MKIIVIFFILFSLSSSISALEFKELKTEDGIKIWWVKDESLPIISISFSFNGGSYLDEKGKEGTAYLMSALLDEGTKNFSSNEYKIAMKSNGMNLSFATAIDKIGGNFQIISTQKNKGFELFYEAVNFPTFSYEEIEKVKKQIVSSIKIENSDVSSVADIKFDEFFFGSHDFSRRIKGSIESIERISRKDLVAYQKNVFTKDNIVIGVAGNISEKEVKQYISMVFGNLPSVGNQRKLSTFNSLKMGEEVFEMDTPQTTVVFGQPGISRTEKNYFVARIANYILGGGGFQSRLYKEIREKRGLVYSIYSYLDSYKMDGVIVGGFQTRNHSVMDTIEMVKGEWSKISSSGVTSRELQDAKTYYKGSFSRNLTSSLSIANLLKIVQYYNLGNDYFVRRDKIIDDITLEQINNLISNLIDRDKLFFMIVGKPEL